MGGAERAAKWVRRNPLVASLLLAVAVVLVGGTAGIYWKYLDAVEQKSIAEGAVADKDKALGRERDERKRAEESEREARGQLANSSVLLAEHGRGRLEEARKALRKAERWLDAPVAPGSRPGNAGRLPWVYEAEAAALRAEAEGLFGARKP